MTVGNQLVMKISVICVGDEGEPQQYGLAGPLLQEQMLDRHAGFFGFVDDEVGLRPNLQMRIETFERHCKFGHATVRHREKAHQSRQHEIQRDGEGDAAAAADLKYRCPAIARQQPGRSKPPSALPIV